MSITSWVDKLNESDSRLHKEDVIKQALELHILGNNTAKTFLTLLWYTYNPLLAFHIRQVHETHDFTDRENPWDDFTNLLDNLEDGHLSGNAARQALQQISERFDSNEWNNVCRNVIRKDMRCGISVKTINKICKGTAYQIPVFACQLATNSEGRPEMKGKKRLEPKLDGVRVLMRFSCRTSTGKNAVGLSISRNGKIFDNFKHIENQISEKYNEIVQLAGYRAFLNGFYLDGEVTGKSFQDLMRQARRKEDVDTSDTVFHIFDIIPLAQFENCFFDEPLKTRIEFLEKIRPLIENMPNVKLLPHIDVNLDTGEGRDQLHRYANDMVLNGYEGIMIKDLQKPYECERTTAWLKWKPTITVDLEVTGVEEGTGRNEGRLGALVCEGVDDGKYITVNVGSGYSDSMRDTLWADHVEMDCVIGKKVEVLADAISQNQDGTYSLRFPRFVRFRDDK